MWDTPTHSKHSWSIVRNGECDRHTPLFNNGIEWIVCERSHMCDLKWKMTGYLIIFFFIIQPSHTLNESLMEGGIIKSSWPSVDFTFICFFLCRNILLCCSFFLLGNLSMRPDFDEPMLIERLNFLDIRSYSALKPLNSFNSMPNDFSSPTCFPKIPENTEHFYLIIPDSAPDDFSLWCFLIENKIAERICIFRWTLQAKISLNKKYQTNFRFQSL